ncbi:glyoxalase [Streptomyces sp. NPDC048659]|uniref:glyoxalase n=1 Tax=Streptomyces sp. NPDC048659 TaxID=3155489 RepID=UPI003449627C
MKRRTLAMTLSALMVVGVLGGGAPSSAREEKAVAVAAPSPAVGPQYDTTYVYVSPGSVDAFAASWGATFGGTHTAKVLTHVTPTPSTTESELVFSPVGTLSVFDFKTPVPFPFGAERTGWLVEDLDEAVRLARRAGAQLVVAPFDDPIGRDAIVQFPGGVNTQLYWHTTKPSYPPLESVPDNRVYLTPDSLGPFLASYGRFTGGRVVSDRRDADGGEIGRPGETYRRIALASPSGGTVVSVTDRHLPYPSGRETTGYRVEDLDMTLSKARAAGAQIVWGPYTGTARKNAMVRFPGDYIAELHQELR